jgi:hypothetical protein
MKKLLKSYRKKGDGHFTFIIIIGMEAVTKKSEGEKE